MEHYMKKISEKEVFEIIGKISDIRSKFDIFNNEERKIYHNLSCAIRELRKAVCQPIEDD